MGRGGGGIVKGGSGSGGGERGKNGRSNNSGNYANSKLVLEIGKVSHNKCGGSGICNRKRLMATASQKNHTETGTAIDGGGAVSGMDLLFQCRNTVVIILLKRRA